MSSIPAAVPDTETSNCEDLAQLPTVESLTGSTSSRVRPTLNNASDYRTNGLSDP